MGTTTTGETAPIMAPSMAACSQEKLNRYTAARLTAAISQEAGTKLMSRAGRAVRFRVSRRRVKPARSRMTMRAIAEIRRDRHHFRAQQPQDMGSHQDTHQEHSHQARHFQAAEEVIGSKPRMMIKARLIAIRVSSSRGKGAALIRLIKKAPEPHGVIRSHQRQRGSGRDTDRNRTSATG